ncbi:MAG: c-type cytochrome [Alphaproteobacteria bacterium]
MRLIVTTATCLALLAFAGLGPAYADGDAAAGEKVFTKCKACHSVVAGKSTPTGPNLLGVVGRKAGSTDFKYSDAMTKAGAKGLVWDDKSIVKYLEDPKKYLAGYLGEATVNNKMMFQLKDEKERENVVAYLKSLK